MVDGVDVGKGAHHLSDALSGVRRPVVHSSGLYKLLACGTVDARHRLR